MATAPLISPDVSVPMDIGDVMMEDVKSTEVNVTSYVTLPWKLISEASLYIKTNWIRTTASSRSTKSSGYLFEGHKQPSGGEKQPGRRGGEA